jgi:NAD-reducing hydrogenase small subunit
MGPMSKKRLATVWLDGCSGCHMSFLDMDERLLTVHGLADLVYSPLVDAKEFPEAVDVALVEGAVSTEDDLHKIKIVRERTKTLVSLGDCAVTANVPGMRNPFGVKAVCDRAYRENVTFDPGIPNQVVPALLPNSRPIHEFVTVDVFVPGCPPSADTIYYVVTELLEGRQPDVSAKTRFGS